MVLEEEDGVAARRAPPEEDGVAARRATKERERVLESLDPDAAAEVLSKLSWKEQPELLEALSATQVTRILEELDPDDLADTLQALEDWDPDRTKEVRARLDPEVLAVADSLSGYDEEAAGGLMTPDFVSVRATMTGDQVLAFLRQASPDAETIYSLHFRIVLWIMGPMLGGVEGG